MNFDEVFALSLREAGGAASFLFGLFILSGDAVLVEFVAQGPNADAQHLGRAGTVVARLLKGRQDVPFFKFFERDYFIAGAGQGGAFARRCGCRGSRCRGRRSGAAFGLERESQMLRLHDAVAAKNDAALDDVLQFAHVARPAMSLQEGQTFVGHSANVYAVLARKAGKKLARQIKNVITVFAKRGDMNGNDVEAEKQVLAEFFALDAFFQPPVGGGDDGTSTLMVRLPPTRSSSRSWRTRSSLACTCDEISLISSSRMVPPWASSKRPSRLESAPVKAPFSWQKTRFQSGSRGLPRS